MRYYCGNDPGPTGMLDHTNGFLKRRSCLHAGQNRAQELHEHRKIAFPSRPRVRFLKKSTVLTNMCSVPMKLRRRFVSAQSFREAISYRLRGGGTSLIFDEIVGD